VKKFNIINRPTRLNELNFDESEDLQDDWRLKAERLQARRWRKLRHEMMS
jgi:hypothetical protein